MTPTDPEPTTKAGRQLFAALNAGSKQDRGYRGAILAIEAEARAAAVAELTKPSGSAQTPSYGRGDAR